MDVRVQVEPFQPGVEVEAMHAASSGIGAVASFVGYVRDYNDGAEVSAMTLEHYPGMTEKALAGIAEQARARWPLLGLCIVHRVGCLLPGEPIVFVGTASSHRHAAFEACEFIIDYLKTRAPFWKREATAAGARWVDGRASDQAAAERWD